jgi:RNA polymerase sigma-70 factor, ECF subfamily
VTDAHPTHRVRPRAELAPLDDGALIAGLRAGDEAAFARLVDRYHGSFVRLARHYVPSRAVAEEVAQETWLAVIEGIHRFEGRSSLRTWLFRILVNRARTRGERRTTPLSALGGADDTDVPVVVPERFRGSDAVWAGHWAAPPRRWEGEAEARLLAGETREVLESVIAGLPARQHDVLVLRDVCGLNGPEACEALGLSEANQRVLLHRARGRVRTALEHYLEESDHRP